MPFLFDFSVALLLLIFGKQINPRFLSRASWKALFGIALAGTGAFLIFQSYLQYQAFQKGLIGSVLGSEDGTVWFLSYLRFHIWNTYLVSFLVSVIFFWMARWLNVRRGELLFYSEEPWIAVTSIFLVGYPGVIFYAILMAFVMVFGSARRSMRRGGGERFSPYLLWAPLAIFVILIVSVFFERQGWWASFRF